jgi:sodium/pantothenate symporter
MDLTTIVFSLYFLAVIGLTYYGTRKLSLVADVDYSGEFYVGGRRIGPLALAILIAAGACSTGTFIGCPGLGAKYGPGFTLLFATGQIPINLYILGLLGKKMNIIGRRTDSETYLDIFRYRYENWKPLIFTLAAAILVALTVSSTAEFIGGSRVIQVMTGIPFSYSLIAFAIIITVYTAFGGLVGVSLVGILQGFVMTAATIMLVVGYLTYHGGVTPIFEGLRSIDPNLLHPTAGGQFTLFELFGRHLTYSIFTIGLPWAVQSTLSYKDTKSMKQAIQVGIVFVAIWTIFLMGFGGPASRVYNPDLAVSDMAMPDLAMGILPEYIRGIVLAGIAGAGQSTIAALFMLASGSIVCNLYKAFYKPDVSGAEVRRLSVIATSLVGIINVLLALNPPETLQVFITYAAGAGGCALVPPMVLGLYWPRTNKYGALAGALSGLVGYVLFDAGILGVSVLQQAPLIFAMSLSTLLTVLISMMTKKPTKETIQIYFGEM